MPRIEKLHNKFDNKNPFLSKMNQKLTFKRIKKIFNMMNTIPHLVNR